ncbi:NAD(P)-dependent dehydrogenase (short-subunit alcohol dehydrogenase family) [Variovorax sp. 54]|uniref:SDR family NAD(P)-dependent oxidoreductase n=1 Tax=Variovorax sp. 54 TaxID=2035212 RepID=UPI000C182B76|nr:SDR family oxidoreductase [Variovorax sp. 54]PIF73721.1 NAD(P)-dependent dehydrogenase (short-subunit alcohol dehydrogenase family) [Variovorax sp. 54]
MTTSAFPSGVTLVIGGSGGIGRSICREFARAGSDVALTYFSRESAAQQTADEVRAQDRSASVHRLDTADGAAIAALIDTVAQQHGRIHTIVFSAAAVTEQVYISRITRDQWQRALTEEVSGFFNTVQAALPRFRAWGGGSFVHIGSAGEVVWPARDGLSVIPKAANEAVVRGVAREEGRFNIRANSVLVGVIDAGMHLELQRRGVFDAQWERNTIDAVPLKRIGKAEDIAHAAVFLASDRASYITGHQLPVAGGFGV